MSIKGLTISSLETGSDLSQLCGLAGNGLYQLDLNKNLLLNRVTIGQLYKISMCGRCIWTTTLCVVGTRGQGLFKGVTVHQNFVDPLANSSLNGGTGSDSAVHYASDDTLWLANDKGSLNAIQVAKIGIFIRSRKH